VSGVVFGATELPEREAATLRRAVCFEWITIAFLAGAITIVGLVAGNSQAMKVALWWTDAVAALFISLSILTDGVKNMRSSIMDLTDVRATTFDNKKPHPVVGKLEQYLRGLDWVAEAGVRARDEGHVFTSSVSWCPRPAGNHRWTSWRRPGSGA
jgi:divalent metal cation (Fe/Co/Zn/Cd) transporter